jgi:hypothetical protein
METTQDDLEVIVGGVLLSALFERGLCIVGIGDAGNAAAIILDHPTYSADFNAVAVRLSNASNGIWT